MGVRVHEVAAFERGGDGQVHGEGAQGVVGTVQLPAGPVPDQPVRTSLAPGVALEIGERAQLLGQELDMDTGAAVDVRRVLTAQQAHLHDCPPRVVDTLLPLMATHMPRLGQTAAPPRAPAAAPGPLPRAERP